MATRLEFLDGGCVVVRATNVEGITPLHFAARGGQPSTIEFLVKQGADLRAVSKQKRNALHFSAEGNNAATAKFLLDKGLDANSRDAQGMTPLAIAQSLGGENEDVVQVLKAKTR